MEAIINANKKNPILFFSTILLLIFSLVGCSETQQDDNTPSKPHLDLKQQKEAVKATLVEMWDAIEKEDLDRYASYVHPDFTQFGETDSVLRVGKGKTINIK